MKSSTLHRSNLSKEKMDLLREIKAQRQASGSATPGIYVRPAKEKELDVLWQTFKVNQHHEKSVNAYMFVGFIGGALAMFLLTALISFATHAFSESAMTLREKNVADTVAAESVISKNEKKVNSINFLPPDNAKTVVPATVSTTNFQTYTIKQGDTLDKIAVRFYGKYDSAMIDKIAQANGIANPHQISVGQVIKVPMN